MLNYQPLSQFVENIPEHHARALKKIIKDDVFGKVTILAVTEKATFYAFMDGPFFGVVAVDKDSFVQMCSTDRFVQMCSTDSGIVFQQDYS